ncbi:MAG: dihydrolipoyl dehydrogenase [Candidatus Micrarchaeota archaeon]
MIGGCIAYNAVIIGGGPGGYVCALRLAQLGANIALVEEKSLGGICANSGCIPVKALHASAKVLRKVKGASRHGVNTGEVTLDYAQLRKRALMVSKVSVKGIGMLLKKAGVEVVNGHARLISKDSIEVNGKTLETENIVLATGSVPIQLPGIPFEDNVLSSDSMLGLEELPSSLLVVGGGYVGVEYASIFASLGCKVALVEMMDQILPNLDQELVSVLQKSMERDCGIEVKVGAKLESISEKGAIVNGEEIEAEKILVSVGRKPNFSMEELGAVGVKYERGILTDGNMRTDVKNIYAIGDVVGKGMLAHVASAEGEVAAENIMGNQSRMDYSAVPSCVFSFPEIAVVGSNDSSLRVGRFPFAANGKARALGETDGMIKVYVKDDVLAGVGIIRPDASELIGEACIAVRNKLKVSDITGTIHPHPVLSEAFVEACLDAEGRALHK